MNANQSFLTDPRRLVRTWPGLKTALFQFIHEAKAAPWSEAHTHAFLESFGYRVEVIYLSGPYGAKRYRSHVWADGQCVKPLSPIKPDGTREVATLNAYRAALGMLEKEVLTSEGFDFHEAGRAARTAQTKQDV